LFKEITEAYSILGDAEKRARYDQLIFGDSARGEFDNQEAYEYWKDRRPGEGSGRMRDPLKDQ
jgi:DnaJ-class molecular chaperone